MDTHDIKLLNRLKKEGYIHASNLFKKVKDKKFKSNKFQNVLRQHLKRYLSFKSEIENTDSIIKKVELYNKFKRDSYLLNTDLEGNPIFVFQTKFLSSILEEFIQLLLIPIANKYHLKCGSKSAYCQLSIENIMDDYPKLNISSKNQDVTIYKEVKLRIHDSKQIYKLNIPIVSIECKTYLDKTMLESSSSTAFRIKQGSSFAKFFIVTETYAVNKNVIRPKDIDKIYITKKAKHEDGKDHEKDVKADVIQTFIDDVSESIENCIPLNNLKFQSGYI